MTGFLWISVIVALATPALTRGSYRSLFLETRWEWGLLLAGGVALALASDHLPTPHGIDLGFGALLAAYGLLLAFCGRNIGRAGVAVVMIGLAVNALAITVNHGMPVRVPERWVAEGGISTTATHHPTDTSTHLYWLGDVIYVPGLDEMISFGDLIVAAGLVDIAFQASRRRRTAVATAERRAEAHAAPSTALEPLSAPGEELVRVLPRDRTGRVNRGERAASAAAAGTGDDLLERVDDGARRSVGVPAP